jgi:hypothetical protein
VKLVAWNCLAAAGPQFYEIDDLVASIEPAISAGSIGMETSLGGGMMLRGGESGTLSAELAIVASLDIAARCDREAADAVVSRIFNLHTRHNSDFVTRAQALIDQEGWNVTIEREPRTFRASTWGDWDKAQLRGDRFILSALAGDEIEAAEFGEFTHLLNLSAFVQMSKMSEVAASDVWGWTRTFDPAPATHVIEVFASISGIDQASCAARPPARIHPPGLRGETRKRAVALPTATPARNRRSAHARLESGTRPQCRFRHDRSRHLSSV